MAKTKKGITIPKYTLAEELMNSISHGVGALLAIAALVLMVVKSALYSHDAFAVVSVSVYGAMLIILYVASTIYHALKVNRAKKVFRILDHCAIFLLIAGTYTPYTLVTLRGPVGWVMFGVVWASAIIGVTLNAISLEKFKVFSMICYLASGWVIVFAFGYLWKQMPSNGSLFLILGGVAYTIGAVLYGIGKKKKYMHSVFHLFVLIGSILHFFSIMFYVLPSKI